MHEHLDKKPVPNSVPEPVEGLHIPVPELVKGPYPFLFPYHHPRGGAKTLPLQYETP